MSFTAQLNQSAAELARERRLRILASRLRKLRRP